MSASGRRGDLHCLLLVVVVGRGGGVITVVFLFSILL